MNDLISKYVAEKENLQREKNEFAYRASQMKGNSNHDKGKSYESVAPKKTRTFKKYGRCQTSRKANAKDREWS